MPPAHSLRGPAARRVGAAVVRESIRSAVVSRQAFDSCPARPLVCVILFPATLPAQP